MLSHIILPKCCKEKEPEDEHMCITVHIINNNICDANPLDNLSTKVQLSKHCLTYQKYLSVKYLLLP